MNTAPKMRFATPIPPNRVELTLHRTSEAYPPAKVGQYVSFGPCSAENLSQDNLLVLSILEDSVKGG